MGMVGHSSDQDWTALPPRRRTDVTVHELDGEALVFDPKRGDTHRLNETAYLIWNACDGRHSPAFIAQQLIDGYDVSPQEVHAQVTRLLGEIADRGLLESAEVDGAGTW